MPVMRWKRGLGILIVLSTLLVIFSAQAQEPGVITPTEEIVSETLPTDEPTIEAVAPTREVSPTDAPLSTVEISPTTQTPPTPLPAPQALSLFYSASFDAGYPSELSARTGWLDVNVEHGKALQASTGAVPVTYLGATFGDGAVEARFLINTGEGQVALRGYTAALSSDDTLTLSRNQIAVASAQANAPVQTWTMLRLQVVGAQVQASVDGVLLINYTDAEPLPVGQAGFAASTGAVLRVDDLTLYGTPVSLTPVESVSTSEPKSEVSIAPMGLPGQPPAPTNIQGTSSSAGIVVTWTDNSTDEIRYEIERNNSGFYLPLPVNATRYTDTFELKCGFKATYRVRAVNNVDYGVWSASITVSMPDCVPTCDANAAVQRVTIGTMGLYEGLYFQNPTPTGRVISNDGRYVLFASASPLTDDYASEIALEGPRTYDLYRHDALTCTTIKVSVGDDEQEATLQVVQGVMSDDGNLVAFTTNAPGLVDEPYSGMHTFIRNISAGTTTRLDYDTGLGTPEVVDLSPDGRYVLFSLIGANIPGSLPDANGAYRDIILYDTQTETAIPVSVNRDGTATANSYSTPLTLFTANGKVYVLFTSWATNVVPGQNSQWRGFFIRNVTDGITTGYQWSIYRFLHLTTLFDVIVHDNKATITLVGSDLDASPSLNHAWQGEVTLDVPGPFPMTVVSRSSTNIPINLVTNLGYVSQNGRWYVFATDASNVVPNDTNQKIDVFVRDLMTGMTQRVSVMPNGAQSTEDYVVLGMSADGRRILVQNTQYPQLPSEFFLVHNPLYVPDGGTPTPIPTEEPTVDVTPTEVTPTEDVTPEVTATEEVTPQVTATEHVTPTTTAPVEPTSTPSKVPFDCKKLLLGEATILYNTLTITLINDNVESTQYSHTSIAWSPALITASSPYARPFFVSINDVVNWQGSPGSATSPVLTTNAALGDDFRIDDPVSPTDIYNLNTSVTVAANATTRWTLTFINLMQSLSQLVSLADFNGTVIYVNNPDTGQPCALTVQVPTTPTPTPTASMTPSFYCGELSITNISFSGASTVVITLVNQNDQAYKYRGAEIVWNPARIQAIDRYAYPAGVSMFGDTNWNGYFQSTSPILTNNLAQGDDLMTDDPLSPTDSYFPNIRANIPAHSQAEWRLFYSGLTRPLSQAMDLSEMSGTRLTLVNPITGAVCTLTLDHIGVTVTPNGSPTATQTPYTITPTPTLTPQFALQTPELMSPLHHAVVTASPRVSWLPVEGAVNYDVQLDDAQDFATPRESLNTTETEAGFSSTIHQGVHWWRVRARDAMGGVSDWSQPFSFTVNHTMSPAESSIVASATLPASVTFRWADLQNSSFRYRVEVDDDPFFGSINYQSAETAQTTITLTNLAAGQYHWRVRVIDAVSGVIPFVGTDSVSAYFMLTIPVTRAPQPVSPANNALLQPDQRPAVPLTWTWGSAGVPEGSPFAYDIEIDTSAGFYTESLITLSGQSELSVVTPDLSNGTYFWHVRAISPYGLVSPWSPTFRFVIDDEPPAAPTITAPATAAVLTTARPTVTWTSVPGAVRYSLEIGEDCGFSTPVYTVSSIGTSHTIPGSVPALPQDEYRACVRAYDASGNASDYALGNQTFDPGQPFVVSLALNPANGAFVTTSTKPTFTWAAVAGIPGETVRYRVRLFNADGSVNQESPLVTGTSYTLPTTLPQGTYLWKIVRVVNNVEDDSILRTLFVGALAAGPVLRDPAANALVGVSVDLFWDRAVPPVGLQVTAYQLQVSRNSGFSTSLYDVVLNSDSYPLDQPIGTPYEAEPNQNHVTHYWRVRGLWNGLPVTNWSARSFIVDNVVPAVPVITSPANNALVGTLQPSITWNAVPGAVSYDVRIYDSFTYETLVQQSLAGTSLTPSFNLPQTALMVLVYANDGVNASTPAASMFNVRLGNTPAQNAFPSSLRPTFTWTAVAGATGYSLQIDDDVFFDDPDDQGDTSVLREMTLGAVTSHMLAADLPGSGVYYWRLKPNNGQYPTGSRTFYVASSSSMKPTGLYAASESPDNPPQTVFNHNTQFIALAWTPVTITPPQYDVMISSSSSFPTEGTVHGVPPEASGLFYVELLTEGVKYWRVRAVYSADGTSYGPWSDVRTFTLDREAPLPPLLTAPAQETTISTTRPTFAWAASVGSVRYILDAFDSSWYTPVPGLERRTVTGTSYTVPTSQPALNQNNTSGYLWSVYAQDAAGNESSAAMTRLLYVFSGLTPNNNQALTDTTPTFTWTGVTGVGAAPWQLEIAHDWAMTDIVYTSPSLSANATSFILPNANALPQGVYYWRVARSSEDLSLIAGRAFSIGSASSVTPTPLTPAANGWINAVDMWFGIEFSWQAPTAFTPDYYVLEVASASSFAANTLLYSREMSIKSWTASDLSLGEGTYYWRVRGVIGQFTGPASAPRAMRVDLTPPSRPLVIAPVVNDVLTTRTPTFKWEAVSGVTSYILTITDDETSSTPTYTVTLPAGTLQHMLPAASALSNRNYAWSLSAVDQAGNLGIVRRVFMVVAP